MGRIGAAGWPGGKTTEANTIIARDCTILSGQLADAVGAPFEGCFRIGLALWVSMELKAGKSLRDIEAEAREWLGLAHT